MQDYTAIKCIKEDPVYQSKIQDEAAGKAYMKKFSEEVFRNADEDIRMKRQKYSQTSKGFLAAVNFFEVMRIWGELSQDVLYKIKYAKKCAIDIIKVYRSGKDPNDVLFDAKDDSELVLLPEKELLNASEKTVDRNSLSKDLLSNSDDREIKLSTEDSLSLKNIKTFDLCTKKVEENKEASSEMSCISTSNIQIIENRIEKIEKAQKHARWAISALNFEDLKTATHELKLALALLESI
ncbi:unnamed protein product [Pneumocystis jirovecii]|uniref:Vta1 C-terminal domain-containing protein n=1 Tax=Pneumocystis jirovecii TaxID=42068 RepID=L0PHM6_PNEJI|nr:unnamed protein product [Pneumocystis jirovecii]CCJ31174.1 unnamed protein product [Pneumocystis jirovecii]